MSRPDERQGHAVVRIKGAAAEGRPGQFSLGLWRRSPGLSQTAERYGLIAELPRYPAFGGRIGAFRDFGSCAMQAAFSVSGCASVLPKKKT